MALFTVEFDGDGDGVDLVVMRTQGKRARFVNELLIPWAADEIDTSGLGEGDP